MAIPQPDEWEQYASPAKKPVRDEFDQYAAPAKDPVSTVSPSTIGPPPRYKPNADMENKVEASGFTPLDIEHYTQEGRAEHPILSRIGDVISSGREFLTGGQAADKPMGTSQGILNSPVTNAISAVPAAAETAGMLESGIGRVGNMIRGGPQRILRGPTGAEPVTINPATVATRELEAHVPMNEPPGARGEMEAATRAKEAAEVTKHEEFAKSVSDTEAARQKELGDMGRLRLMDTRSSLMGNKAAQAAEEEQHGLFAKRLQETERARQAELGDIEGLKQQHAESIWNRGLQSDRSLMQSRAEALQAGQTAPGPWQPGRRSLFNLEPEATGEEEPLSLASGLRPQTTERQITRVVRKPIVTPEEAAFERRQLAQPEMQPGEGLMDRQSRLLGTVRSRRAGRGMKEPR